MFIERIGHGITSFLFGKPEPDKLQSQQINNLLLDVQSSQLLYSIGLCGPVGVQQIYNNIERIKEEMIKRGLSSLRLDGQYAIILNVDRINIIKE